MSIEGGASQYLLRFVLAEPGQHVFRANVDLEQFAVEGASLLATPQETARIEVRITGNATTGTVHIGVNDQKQVSFAEVTIQAANFLEAETRAHDLVIPLVSWWSFQHDVGIEIAGFIVTELATGSRKVAVGLLGEIKPLHGDGVVKSDYSELFAAYRQGLNATDTFFSVLSFWKVIEGVKHRRDIRAEQARTTGQNAQQPSETIPATQSFLDGFDPEIRSLIQPYVGRKFTWVRETLRPTLRNAITHIDPRRPVLSGDRYADIIDAQRALPVLRYMARELIRTELASDADLQGVTLD